VGEVFGDRLSQFLLSGFRRWWFLLGKHRQHKGRRHERQDGDSFHGDFGCGELKTFTAELLTQTANHAHAHRGLAANATIEGKIGQGIDLTDGFRGNIAQDAIAHGADASGPFAVGVHHQFSLKVKEAGKQAFG